MAQDQVHTDHVKKHHDVEPVSYPRWILKRILLLILVAIIMMIIGTMVGYKLGGGNPFKVFLPSTWQHIFDFFH
ncbi:DNA-directed RNA polymerase subunit beta [Agrilactobacillus yilanensis]|uniref:DNA-directed RNA polymerase subunit beta n=1 Tax=Agrilactobacillus yilanensis TaxID=2485997 RepID=A0ABW4J6H2_9LACO